MINTLKLFFSGTPERKHNPHDATWLLRLNRFMRKKMNELNCCPCPSAERVLRSLSEAT